MKSLLVAAVLCVGLLPAPGGTVVVKTGDPAPEMVGKWIEYPAPEGKLSDLQGHYVFVEFWRTW